MDHRVQLLQGNDNPDSILVFSRGELEHLLAAVPAFWAVRRRYPHTRLTLLSDEDPNSVSPALELLAELDLFDGFERYPVQRSRLGRLLSTNLRARLAELRAARFDKVVYLMPSERDAKEIERDHKFFADLGIDNFIGLEYPAPAPKTQPLPWVTHETDALLARLAGDGIAVPHPGQAEIDLGLNWNEEVDVDRWLQLLPPDGERQWVAIGPSARTPAGGWPQERLKAAVASLISKHNIWPVVFGGPEVQLAGEAFVQMWQCGYNAAGYLKLRATARALGRCSLYLGNENYVMHLAAAVGVPCVAIFSAVDHPGRWYPYGYGHAVLRTETSCAGCGLKECERQKSVCIRSIETREVVAACGQYLEQEVWAAA